MTSPEVAQLARRIKRSEKPPAGPQLAFSSIEDGAVNEYDIDGQLSSVIGKQFDGTHGAVTISGPNPPTPHGAIVGSIPIGIIVRWEGIWEPLFNPNPEMYATTPVIAPMDFAHMEVHVSTDPNFTGMFFATLRGQIPSARGGDVQIPIVDTDTDVYVRLVARSTSGKASLPSAITGPIRPGKVPTELMDVDFDAIGGNTIFVGMDEPVTDRIGDLWLREPMNIAHRWDGADWVELRDQGVVEAITEAYNAQQAAAQAGLDAIAALAGAEDAGDAAEAAQIDADQALLDAAAANTLAGQAKTAADSKITAFRQASAPSTTGRTAGDIWIDSDDGLVYVWTGAWTLSADQRIGTLVTSNATKITVFAQTSAPTTTGRTVGDLWIDTDDGNKVYTWVTSGTPAWTARTLGAAAISATARQLGAITTYRQATAPASGMVVGDFWIDSDDNKLYRYEGTTPTWVVVQDVAIQTAITNAATAQAVADGKMRIFVQDSAPTGLVAGDAGDLWIESDNGNRPWTWDGTAWSDRRLGNAAIKPQSIIASEVVATGTITAALLEAQFVLANVIIAGNPNAGHARMTPQGFFAYAMGPDGPYVATKLGTTDNDTLTLTDSTGKITAAIDTTGKIVGRSLSISEWPTVGGVDLKKYIDSKPRGLMTWGEIPQSASGLTTGEARNSITNFMAEPGRMYRITAGPVRIASTVNSDWGQLVLRYTTDGSEPTPSSGFLSYGVGTHNTTQTLTTLYQAVGVAGTLIPVKILLTYLRNFGSGQIAINGTGGYLVVEDIGPAIPANIATAVSGVSTGTPKASYTSDFSPTWWSVFRGNNTLYPSGNDLYQGYEATNGNMKTLIGYPDMTPTLSGATITGMWVYLYAEHWWNMNGGNPYVGSHPKLAAHTDWNSSGANSHFVAPGMTRGEGRWIELPSAWWANYGNGTNRGIVLGPGPDNSGNYYGRFDGPSTTLRVSYIK